jgi:hypothetical protein
MTTDKFIEKYIGGSHTHKIGLLPCTLCEVENDLRALLQDALNTAFNMRHEALRLDQKMPQERITTTK